MGKKWRGMQEMGSREYGIMIEGTVRENKVGEKREMGDAKRKFRRYDSGLTGTV